MSGIFQPRASTPATIYCALACFLFAIASPFIGDRVATLSHGDGWHVIGVMLPWLLAGGASALVGVICTCIGAWRSPRSVATIVAIVVATLFAMFFLWLLGFSLS